MTSIIDQLESGALSIDQVLHPGRYLHEMDPDSLEIQVMDSGFPTLDKYMLLKKDEGELIIIGARPSVGKSALAFQIARNVSINHEVHVFSLEMSHSSIGRRMLSTRMGCTIADIQYGRVREEVPEGINTLKHYKFFLDDRSGISADQICDAAREHYRQKETKLIVIDYCQILGIEKGHSRALEIAEATGKLKALAKELKCPVILLSQLNRNSETRGASSGNYKPVLADLKESGSIEQDADIVLGIDREYMHTRLRIDEADVLILKNRNGPLGEEIFKFDAATASFRDLQDDGI
jgi:replicative DNA helicase